MKIQTSQILRGLLLTIILTTALGLAACSSAKKAEDEGAPTSAPSVDENSNQMGDSDSGQAMGIQTITFGYDSFVLEADERAKLKANADIMKNSSGIKVQIEGHCDNRGGIQYNIALGEKRANAVKKALEGMGIGGDRLTTISYGKERPLDPGNTEAAFAKNRRANFAITSK